MSSIFISGNVPSLKNSKIKTRKGIFPSKTVMKYLREMGVQKYSVSKQIVVGYKTRENKFAQYKQFFDKLDKSVPNVIEFHFVRNSKHKFDFHNAVQIIADLMVAHGYIEDDNMDYFIPMPFKKKGDWYSYDKDNPGVHIKIR